MVAPARRARPPKVVAPVPPVIKDTSMTNTPIAAAALAVTAIAVSMSIDALFERLDDQPGFAERAALQVVGPSQGRRRADRNFGPEAQIIPLVLLGEDELRAIDSDPLLSWSIIELPMSEPDEGE